MLSIILANKALAVSVKFSNSAYDVTVMYNCIVRRAEQDRSADWWHPLNSGLT